MSDNPQKTFIDRCVQGKASVDEIDDFVDRWHDGDYGVALHEFLGMSWKEYARWMNHPESLSEIIETKRNTSKVLTSRK